MKDVCAKLARVVMDHTAVRSAVEAVQPAVASWGNWWIPRGLSRPKGQMWVDMVRACGVPAALAISSRAWIRPAQKETNEMVGISPVISSSRVCTQPAQAEPGVCAETRTKSWELDPTQTQCEAAARWAAQRDGMWSTPTSSRGASEVRPGAAASLNVSPVPVMRMQGVWKLVRARVFCQPSKDLRARVYLLRLGRSSRSGSMTRMAAVTAGMRSRV